MDFISKIMKNYYPYENCRCAAEATDKIIFNDSICVYFPDSETAGEYLKTYSQNADFHYEWMQREIDWETGPKKNWVMLEIGSSDYLKYWCKMIGIEK